MVETHWFDEWRAPVQRAERSDILRNEDVLQTEC